MSGENMPAEWALERANELILADIPRGGGVHMAKCAETAFARYIEQHEEPPVDPIVEEAREIVKAFYPDMRPDYNGRRVAIVIEALQRGRKQGVSA